jgi:hypothetical protein
MAQFTSIIKQRKEESPNNACNRRLGVCATYRHFLAVDGSFRSAAHRAETNTPIHTQPLAAIRKEEFQMMEEISEHRIEEYIKYFPGSQPDMVLASVIEGNTEAQLWYTSQPDNNVVCLLWDKGNNVFYLSGQLVLSETIKDLASLINTSIKEKAIKVNCPLKSRHEKKALL